MASERHDHRLFVRGEDGRMHGPQPHPRIVGMRRLAPLLDGRRGNVMPSVKRPYALQSVASLACLGLIGGTASIVALRCNSGP